MKEVRCQAAATGTRLLVLIGSDWFPLGLDSVSVILSFCQVRKLGMMAGGTGITPMLQIISAVMREAGGMGRSTIEMSLIFANKSEDDILLRDMIEKLVRHQIKYYRLSFRRNSCI